MDLKKLALMLGALILAAVCAIMARNMFSAASPAAAQASVVAGPDVLVATRELPVGTIISADAFRYQPWPNDLVEKAYFLRGQVDVASLNGRVVRAPITAGQPLTQGSLVKPGDSGFLAAALAPGMRAVTVAVSQQTGVAGFIFPGDRVDIVLTQTVGGGDATPLKASETIIRNIRVLATDQRTDNVTDDKGKTQVTTFSNVTMEATPKIAEKIAVAQAIGTLSLSLRPLADNMAELERAIAAGEVSVPDTDDPKAEKRMLLAIASRPMDTDITYTVGADVSRFQRGTVPQPSRPQASPAAPTPVAQQGPIEPPRPQGPTVRIARGNSVSEVAMGVK
jgi:pilus assembly protein CpaB